MRTLLVLTRTEAKLFLREPAALFFTLALPLIILTLNGGRTSSTPAPSAARSVSDVLVPGLILLVLCTAGLMALPETLASYRERGFLRRLRIAPVRASHVLGAHAATHLAVTLVGIILLITLGRLAFDLAAPAAPLVTAVAVAASATTVGGIGFLLAAVLPTARTTQAVAAAIYFPSIFLSGAVMPAEALPPVASHLSAILPFTHGVRAMSAAWESGTIEWGSFAILGAVSVVATTAALRIFRWEPRY